MSCRSGATRRSPGSRSASQPPLRLPRATPGNLGRVVGIDCGTGLRAEQGGGPDPQSQPRRRPGAGEAAAALAGSGLASKTSKKSLGLRVFRQVPDGVRTAAAAQAAPRELAAPQESLGRDFLAECGCTGGKGEQRLRATRRSRDAQTCRTTPTPRTGGEPEGSDHFAMDPSNSGMGRRQPAIAFRERD